MPFVVCTTNGYVVDIDGVYEVTVNDAAILLNFLDKDLGLQTLINKGDFIQDRGFRDTVDDLEMK